MKTEKETNGTIKCEKWKDCYFKQLTRKTQECEELKEELKREIKNTVDMERLARSYGQDMLTYRQEKQIEIEELQTNIDRYRKALEEIEVYVQSQLDGFGNDVYAMNKVAINKILDIINKAKGR